MCCTGYCKLGLYPVLFTVFSTVTFLITYAISVSKNDVYPYLPTISDTGGIKPESNVFGFLLSCCGFLGFMVILIRYYQYRFISENNEEWYSNLIRINQIALFFGVMSSLGIQVVASFQDRGSSGLMHGVGALICFGCGIVYCFLQSFLTFKMYDRGINSQCLLIIRMAISCFALLFFIGNQVLSHLSSKEMGKSFNCTVPLWKPKCPGFKMHVAADASEWAMALSLFSYFLTFYSEFNRVRMTFNFRNRNAFLFSIPYTPDGSED